MFCYAVNFDGGTISNKKTPSGGFVYTINFDGDAINFDGGKLLFLFRGVGVIVKGRRLSTHSFTNGHVFWRGDLMTGLDTPAHGSTTYRGWSLKDTRYQRPNQSPPLFDNPPPVPPTMRAN
jgi:hypothetical protein